MTTSIIIQQESPREYSQVFDLHQHAFLRGDEAMLVSQLRKSASFIPGLSLVAMDGDRVVGHILYSQLHIKNRQEDETGFIALAPVAVLPPYQKKGIGTMLINRSFEIAKKLGYRAVIVLGHENYYPKFGFQPASRWGIKTPFAVPDANFMALELVPGALEGNAGIVEYAKEFGLG